MATPTTPVLTVEIAFASDTLNTSPTWTDVTAYVRDGSIKFGRSNELDEFQAGSATLTLDNRDRRFDPLHASGPYYGNLKARKQLRIKATWNSTTYTLFTGFVATWGVSPDISGDSTWQLEAYDALAYLATLDLPPDVLWYTADSYTYPAVKAYWPLGDTTVIAQDRTTTYNYTYTTATPKTSENPKFVSGAAQQFDGTYGLIGPVLDGYLYQWSVTFLLKTGTAGPAGGFNPIMLGADSVTPTSIGIDEYGRLAFRRGAGNTAHSGFAITDDIWHYVVVAGGAAACDIYVDGILLSGGNTTGDGYDGDGFQLIGMSNVSTDSPFFTGELSSVAVWDAGLSSANAAQLAKAALQGVPSSSTTSDAWVALILDAAGWPSAWRSLETGTVQPGGMVWADQNALSMLQVVARTERGRIFASQDGIVTFHSSSHDFTAANSITSQWTFSDSGLSAVIPFSSIGRIAYSDEYLANRVTVTTIDNVAYTTDSTTSQTTYGIKARQIDTIVKNGSDALNHAAVVLAKYESPQLRIDEWGVLPQTKASTSYPAVLGVDLADRVTIEIKPSNVGTRISQEVLVESIDHRFTPDRWESTFSGSPAIQVWVLEDATYGLLESTTILG